MGGESRAAAPPRRMGAGWPHARRGRMPPRPSARHGQQQRCRRRGVASAGCRRAVRHIGRRTCRSRGAPGAATTAAASPPPHLRQLAGGRAASLERGGVATGRHEQRGPACSTVQTHSKFVKIVVFGEAPRPLNTSRRKKKQASTTAILCPTEREDYQIRNTTFLVEKAHPEKCSKCVNAKCALRRKSGEIVTYGEHPGACREGLRL